MGYTTPAEFENAYKTLFKTFSTGKTKDLKWRKWQLKQLWWLVADNEEAFIQALKEDLNRPAFETSHADLLGMKMDILEHIENLEKWTADARPDAGFIFGKLGGARIRKEPLGVALIIGAWNFPLLLLMQPLIPAIAAGNCVMLKPSELATATEKLLVELVPKYLDQDAIRIVTGGPADTGRILEHRFNHIFFTGSSKVARFITAAAAKHLTPTVLELGGQGPAIVTASADVDLAAKSIALSKYQNAGQICLSTNHVFVDPKIHDEFVLRLEYWFDQFVGDAPDSFTHIVNERNYDRLTNMVEATSGKIVYSGKNDKKTRYMHPTVVIDITLKGK
jgi:aldehyde dehydrogenase (NAD+)